MDKSTQSGVPPLPYWFSGWGGVLGGSKVCLEGGTGNSSLPYGAGGGAGHIYTEHSNWKSTRIKSVCDTPQYSSLSMILVCLQITTGIVLQCPPCCKFLLKFWISSFVAMWHENQTKENNDSIAGGTGQPTCCHYFSVVRKVSFCDLTLPLFILFYGFLLVERGSCEPTSNRSSEIQAQTLTDRDTFLCPSAWCSPCSQFCAPRPFTSLLLQFRNSIGLSWVVYLWGWRDS